jgi:hypothetical protein
VNPLFRVDPTRRGICLRSCPGAGLRACLAWRAQVTYYERSLSADDVAANFEASVCLEYGL